MHEMLNIPIVTGTPILTSTHTSTATVTSINGYPITPMETGQPTEAINPSLTTTSDPTQMNRTETPAFTDTIPPIITPSTMIPPGFRPTVTNTSTTPIPSTPTPTLAITVITTSQPSTTPINKTTPTETEKPNFDYSMNPTLEKTRLIDLINLFFNRTLLTNY